MLNTVQLINRLSEWQRKINDAAELAVNARWHDAVREATTAAENAKGSGRCERNPVRQVVGFRRSRAQFGVAQARKCSQLRMNPPDHRLVAIEDRVDGMKYRKTAHTHLHRKPNEIHRPHNRVPGCDSQTDLQTVADGH